MGVIAIRISNGTGYTHIKWYRHVSQLCLYLSFIIAIRTSNGIHMPISHTSHALPTLCIIQTCVYIMYHTDMCVHYVSYRHVYTLCVCMIHNVSYRHIHHIMYHTDTYMNTHVRWLEYSSHPTRTNWNEACLTYRCSILHSVSDIAATAAIALVGESHA